MEHHNQPDYGGSDAGQSITKIRGFSLIELVIVIIIVSVAAVPILGLFRGVGMSLLSNDDLQIAQQTSQACTEHILGIRRRNTGTGFSSIATTSCNGLTVPAGFTRALNVTSVTNATLSACPSGASCKNVSVSVSKGTLVADTALLLTNY